MHILLADDHDLVREALVLLLMRYFDGFKVSEAESVDGAFDLMDTLETPLSLIMLDLRMSGMDGLNGLTRTIEKTGAEVPVVLISGAFSSEDVRLAIKMGARGFIPKTLRGEALANAIRLVLSGERYLPSFILSDIDNTLELEPQYQRSHSTGNTGNTGGPETVEVTPEPLSNGKTFSKLTPREQEVLTLLAVGRQNRDIARELNLREITVKYHLKNIYRKLEVNNRAQAVKMALERTRTGS